MRMSQGDLAVLFSSTLGNILWVCLIASLAGSTYMDWRRSRRERALERAAAE
jgi:putative tricarboxylic transport membrane protein